MFKTVRHVKRAPQVPSGRVSNVSPSLRNPSCKAVKTPSNQTGSDMLAELEKYTTVLPDSTLSPEKMTEAGSSSAVVNTALLSHILANTSAFYEFAVCTLCDVGPLLQASSLNRIRNRRLVPCQFDPGTVLYRYARYIDTCATELYPIQNIYSPLRFENYRVNVSTPKSSTHIATAHVQGCL